MRYPLLFYFLYYLFDLSYCRFSDPDNFVQRKHTT